MTQELHEAQVRLDGLLCELSKELGRHWNDHMRAWRHVDAIRDAIQTLVLENRRELTEVHSDF